MNIPAAKSGLLRRLGCAALVFITPIAHAAVYDFYLGDEGSRSLRLNIPDSVPVVRGIIIYGNGANLDARSAATDPELVALATSLECAVMGTAYWGYFSDADAPMELPGFKYGLKQLSTKSQHPEIFNAPWMPSGMSNGGNLSYELNAQRPTKVITFMSNKGGYYSHLRPEAAALSNPGVLIAGQLDDALHHEVIQELFTGNRPRGALWVAMEEEGVAHNTGNAREFFYPYLEAMFRVRYPARASPVAGPVPLLALNEAAGWLTDPDSYKTGLAEIAPLRQLPEGQKDRGLAAESPARFYLPRICELPQGYARRQDCSGHGTRRLGHDRHVHDRPAGRTMDVRGVLRGRRATETRYARRRQYLCGSDHADRAGLLGLSRACHLRRRHPAHHHAAAGLRSRRPAAGSGHRFHPG
jgi:hypothetical protein